jgi:N-acetylneuraminate synthase
MTLRRVDGGVDSNFAMEPEEFRSLIMEAEVARQSVGKIKFGPSADDLASLAFRRSLYISRNVVAGEKVSTDNVRSVRPGFGLPIKFREQVDGMEFTKDAPAGTPLTFSLFK